jgi:hypothetical protein
MNITLISNKKGLHESVMVCREILMDLEKGKMFLYLPEVLVKGKIEAHPQIKKDIETLSYFERAEQCEKGWQEIQSEVLARLSFLAKKYQVTLPEHIRCVTTIYGPYGYFYAPDTVYVNIGWKDTHFSLETMVHEILHLVFEDVLKEKVEHVDMENAIDALFVENFGHLFPNYYVQPEIH